MIAMQYSFTLPADYDMSIVDRRIRDKGPLLDGFPNLGFKAYLSARKGEFGSHDNVYAPFYLWQRPEGATDFLCGPGFEALTGAFGWPQVMTWIVSQAEIRQISPQRSSPHAMSCKQSLMRRSPPSAAPKVRRLEPTSRRAERSPPSPASNRRPGRGCASGYGEKFPRSASRRRPIASATYPCLNPELRRLPGNTMPASRQAPAARHRRPAPATWRLRS